MPKKSMREETDRRGNPRLRSKKGSEVGNPIDLTALGIESDGDSASFIKLSQEAFLKAVDTPEEIKQYIFDEG